MMKTKKINYTFLLLLIACGFMASCVQDDDFDTPDTSINPPNIDGDSISISDVKNILASEGGGGDGAQYFFEESDKYMSGYVISSDEAGNFYQEIVLQDKPENPTSGIKVLISANPLHTKFEIGRRVFVHLQGFSVGESNGLISLGVHEDGSDFIGKAPQSFEDKLIRTQDMDSIVPLDVAVDDFGPEYENIFVRLNNVQFPADVALGDNAQTFAAEPGDDFDGSRPLESCDGDASTVLLTSSFADFKALYLPKKQGSISAILQKTFNGSEYVLKVNSPSDLDFDQERCDDGEGPSDPGDGDQTIVGLPFNEDFESLGEYDAIDNLDGWTSQAVSGSRTWEARTFGGNHYAQLTAYQATNPIEAWMVTPGIDLSGAGGDASLSFDTKDANYNGTALSVYISTDFDGDASGATWTEITSADISENHDQYPSDFTASGNIDLSSYAGQVIYVGFKYEGSDGGVSSTYQVDNVSVNTDGDGGGDGGGGDGGDNPDPPSDDATLAFAGADFEDWNAFTNGLNQYDLKSYATESSGTGIDGSTSLQIATDPTTTDGNDYVFTATATADLPSSYDRITFYMKGTSDKSVSLNVYKPDGSYYVFNLEDINGDAIIQEAPNNQYNGVVDTGGDWILVSLDLSGISDLNTTDPSADFFALKIGKEVNYDLKFDNFTIE